MKKKLYVVFVLICILAMTSTACVVVDKVKEIFGSISGGGLGKLGEEYRSENGGFSFNKINDYEFSDFFGMVSMTAPDGDQEVGPTIMLIGGTADKEYTAQEMFDQMAAEADTLEISEPKNITVDGVKGLSADISGTYNEQSVSGKIVVIMVTPTQQFSIIGMAPEERWKEVKSLFDAVLKSVKFFEPNPELATTLPEVVVTSEPTQEVVVSDGSSIQQWASSATASSEYGTTSWIASQATGEPDVVDCGDNSLAWAASSSNTMEWIELTYDIPVKATAINIYQSYNPSQVIEVQVTDTNGIQYSVWTGQPEIIENCPFLLTIIPFNVDVPINKVLIVIDQSVLNTGWNEIDAVELVGTVDN